MAAGITLSFSTGFFQVSQFRLWFRSTAGSLLSARRKESENASFSRFGAICTLLAATIGVGNIAGVATAIAMGGPGAVFWMWVAAFLSSSIAFAENTLGVFYRRKGKNGEWQGGAMYYLSDGCKSRIAADVFSFFCILASFGMGNAAQANTIAQNLRAALPCQALQEHRVSGTDLYMLTIGVVLAIAVGAVLLGGAARIGKVTEKIVPFMVVGYMLLSAVVILCGSESLYEALRSVFRHAFSLKSAAGGTAGFAICRAAAWGLRRGVFSNEAGLGASVCVGACSDRSEPVEQGMWGIFQVFTDTFVICTLTALVILCSGCVDLESGSLTADFAETALVGEAYSRVFGSGGGVFIALAILIFAFSTVIGWSFYGLKAWEYLFGGGTSIYKTLYVVAVMVGANIDMSLTFALCDLCNALMLLPNLSGVFYMSGTVRRITQNYKQRVIMGRDVKPMLSYITK